MREILFKAEWKTWVWTGYQRESYYHQSGAVTEKR
nr:MAG TPA_asm: hypothetical protein [Caudoviricetes sp.]